MDWKSFIQFAQHLDFLSFLFTENQINMYLNKHSALTSDHLAVIKEISLLRRLQAQTLPDATSPLGKIWQVQP